MRAVSNTCEAQPETPAIQIARVREHVGADGVKIPVEAVGHFGLEVQGGILDADQRNADTGLDDRIVPRNQAEEMVAALAARGITHAYVPFEGEQHGFRRAENIKRALEAELYFYGKVFGFEPAGEIIPVEINNLD